MYFSRCSDGKSKLLANDKYLERLSLESIDVSDWVLFLVHPKNKEIKKSIIYNGCFNSRNVLPSKIRK